MKITLTGANSFLVKLRLKEITDQFVKDHGDLTLEKIDCSEASFEQIIGSVESLPFLATKKMAVLLDLSLNKPAAEELERIIELAGDTTDLIIVESKLDKRSSYYKNLKKLTDFNEYKEPVENELSEWLVKEAKSREAELRKNDASYLIQRVGLNQMKLSNELEKLIQYNPKITKESIDELTDENPSSTIFNLVDSVFSGNLQQALRIYDDQRKQKVEPQAIQGMLVWQMHTVAIAALAPSDKNSSQIAKESGLNPFVLQKSQHIARKMGNKKIIRFIDLLRELDYRSKHEVIDYDEALRYAIVSLAE